MDTRVFVYSGGSGGKSTFIGGLLQHLYREDDSIVTYDVSPGSVGEFEEGLIRPMMEDREYPPGTESPYVARFDVSFDTIRREDAAIGVVDFPGAWIEDGVDLPPPNPDEARSAYAGDGGVRSRIDAGEPLDESDRRAFLQHHYAESDRVIFLLNLHRITSDDADTTLGYDLGLLREIADDAEVAVVATGVDVIDYDPSEGEAGTNEVLQLIMDQVGIGRSETVDEDLLEAVNREVPKGTSLQLHNIMSGIQSGCGADFFGVAVPSDDDGGIAPSDDGFEVRGFDRVVDWILPADSPFTGIPLDGE